MSKITKVSTLYRKERENNTVRFEAQRNEFLDRIVNSKPRMNVKVVITKKPF